MVRAQRHHTPVVSICLALLTGAGTLPAQRAVIPAGAGGNPVAGRALPFNTQQPCRSLSLYDAGHFGRLGIEGPIRITRLRWRHDESYNGQWGGGSLGSVDVSLSTSPSSFQNPSAQFAANHGADRVLVHSGSVNVASGFLQPYVGIASTIVDLPLSPAFVYDPRSGQPLAVDIQVLSVGGGAQVIGAAAVTSGEPTTQAFATCIEHPSNALAAQASTIDPVCGLVLDFDYMPFVDLVPDFAADVTTGAGPLQVRFNDVSSSTAPGGITAFAWDFDDDGTPDATGPAPTWTFGTGRHTVRLTVSDAQNTRTLRRADFIVVDQIEADFAAHGSFAARGDTVSFFDRSRFGPATAWAWDLDGDGNVDSTVQNPQWTYGTAGRYDVTLTVSGAGATPPTDRLTVRGAVEVSPLPTTGNRNSADILELKFNEVARPKPGGIPPYVGAQEVYNTARFQALASQVDTSLPFHPGGAAPSAGFRPPEASGGFSFNTITYPVPNPLTLRSMTISWWQRFQGGQIEWDDSSFRLLPQLGTSWPFGRRIGYLSSATPWLGTTSNAGRALGWHHIALVVDDARGVMRFYVDGTLDGERSFPPGTHSYTLADGFSIGRWAPPGRQPSFSNLFTVDNLLIHAHPLDAAEIVAVMQRESATGNPFGQGCPGPTGVPTLRTTQPPVNGGTLALHADSIEPGAATLLVLGLQADAAGTFPLNLGPLLGAPCTLECSPDVALVRQLAGGQTSFTLSAPLPLLPLPGSAHLYAQLLTVGTTVSMSRGLDVSVR